MSRTAAIILAGGVGCRMGSSVPKQFLLLGGEPVVSHSIRFFGSSDKISDIVVVCHADHIPLMESIVSSIREKKVRCVVPGGKTRQSSSFTGLKNCPSGTDYVLIHDSARPFLDSWVVEDLLSAAAEFGSAGPVIAVGDTIVKVAGRFITENPDRDALRRIQTPQAFEYRTIMEAHEKALRNGITCSSDDCGLVIASGGRVGVVPGNEKNIKITTALDMELAELIMAERNM